MERYKYIDSVYGGFDIIDTKNPRVTRYADTRDEATAQRICDLLNADEARAADATTEGTVNA